MCGSNCARFSIKESEQVREKEKERTVKSICQGFSSFPLGVAGRVAYPTITGSPLASSSLCQAGPTLQKLLHYADSRVDLYCAHAPHEGAPSNNICDESLALPSRPFLAPPFYTVTIWSFVPYVYFCQVIPKFQKMFSLDFASL